MSRITVKICAPNLVFADSLIFFCSNSLHKNIHLENHVRKAEFVIFAKKDTVFILFIKIEILQNKLFNIDFYNSIINMHGNFLKFNGTEAYK